ncbi:MAG TPA: GatB/YqeY domain-containing protein, partial [Kiritimatiellia bacterium]
SRNADHLTALRTLHAQIKDATVNVGREPTDADVATVVAKAIKQRQDAIVQFRQGGREDLAIKDQKEIDAYRKYQPEQLEAPAIEALVKKAIAESGAAGRKDMGKVMAALMPQVKGRADGKLVNQIVQGQLPA